MMTAIDVAINNVLLPYFIDYFVDSDAGDSWQGRDYFSDDISVTAAAASWESQPGHELHNRIRVVGPNLDESYTLFTLLR